MKSCFLTVLFLGLFTNAQGSILPTPCFGLRTHAAMLKTKTGLGFKNVEIIKADAFNVIICHESGVEIVPMVAPCFPAA